MKKFRIVLLTTALAAVTFLCSSCKENFLSAPTSISVSDSSRAGAPEGLTATHGKSGCIELNWQAVNGATRYYIYGTTEPTPKESDFKQITQTEETSTTIKVNPGSTAWYKIAAVDSSYTIGRLSFAVQGSSLATPEITAILSNEKSDEINVDLHWYMANCNDDTYRSCVTYEIKCTDPSGKSNSIYLNASDLSENHYQIENLSPHTRYTYQVIVRNEIYGDTEESLELTEETLHRLRPAAPLDLSAEKGQASDGVTLKFTTPEAADVSHTSGNEITYKNIPLYFKIFRRVAGSDGAWIVKNEKLAMENYAEGTEITWTDSISGPDRGIKYEYKVQSFIDTSKLSGIMESYDDDEVSNYKYIETSDVYSYATDEGWAMAAPILSIRDYAAVKENDSAESYSSASADFIFKWDNFLFESDAENENLAKNYHYHLYKTVTKFDVDGSSSSTDFVKTFNSIAEVNEYTHTFNLAGGGSGDRGSYIFTIYISDSESPSESGLETVALQNPLIVTDNPGTIDGLEIKGGFKDKFTISWTYDTSYTYTLSYTQKYKGNMEPETYTVEVPSHANGTITLDDTNNLDDRKDFGVQRTYTLTAIQNGATSAPISQTYETLESLGTPQVEFNSSTLAYDSITVSWQKVSGAKNYSIKLGGQTLDTEIVLPGTDGSNVTESVVSGEKIYSYTFGPDEIGETYYADATKSGSEMEVTVKASSDDDFSTGSGNARTLGPAGLNLVANTASAENYIDVSWKAIDGAAGYVLQRLRYKVIGTNYNTKDEDTPELFYINASTLNVETSSGEAIPSSEMGVSISEGTLTLRDSYKEIDGDKSTASQMQKTQSMIPWGIPIEYTVVPVLSKSDKFSNGLLTASSIKDSSHKLTYNNAKSLAKKGATIGYGLNIRASKSEYSDKVKITWDKPYVGDNPNQPAPQFLYFRVADRATAYTSTDRNQISGATSSLTETTRDLKNANAYEYSIKYVKTGVPFTQDKPFADSFMEELTTAKDDLSPTEQKNKGYSFYIESFDANGLDAGGNESFTETVSWSSWDSNIRALGPEDIDGKPAYTIWEKNLNNAAGWFQVGSMDKAGNVTKTSRDWDETTITPGVQSLQLTATGVNDSTGCNNGLLKVQRDAKHYYMIRAQRKDGEKTIYSYRGLDDSVYAYRKISAEELAKAALLIVADANHITGESSNSRSGDKGNFSTTIEYHDWSVPVYYDFLYNFKSYVHKFSKCVGKENELVSSLLLNSTSIGSGRSYDNRHYYFAESTISITGADELLANYKSYQGSITFIAGEPNTNVDGSKRGKFTLSGSYTVNGTKHNLPSISNSESDFINWFPFYLGKKLSERARSSYDAEYPCCKGDWWLVRSGSEPKENFTEEGE